MVAQRAEEGAGVLGAVPCGFEVVDDQPAGRRVQRHVAGLAAFAEDLQVRHAAALVAEVLNAELAQLLV